MGSRETFGRGCEKRWRRGLQPGRHARSLQASLGTAAPLPSSGAQRPPQCPKPASGQHPGDKQQGAHNPLEGRQSGVSCFDVHVIPGLPAKLSMGRCLCGAAAAHDRFP